MFIIIARHQAWGAADNFYEAFKSQGIDVTLLCFGYDKYKRSDSFKNKNIVTILDKKNVDFWFKEAAKKQNRLMVIAPTCLDTLIERYGEKKMASFYKNLKNDPIIFITGTYYLRKPGRWNNYMDKHNFNTRFCTPSFIRFSTEKNVPLFHPMQYDNIDKTKGDDEIVVSHAPGMVNRVAKKGSGIIEKGVELAKKKASFKYDYIMGAPFKECLERKAKSHIFIDQIYVPGGGVGKNSLEALALNCITLSSSHNLKESYKTYCDGYYERPPVITVMNENDVAETLISLINDKNKFQSEFEKVLKWKDRMNYENTVKYILKTLEVVDEKGKKI